MTIIYKRQLLLAPLAALFLFLAACNGNKDEMTTVTGEDITLKVENAIDPPKLIVESGTFQHSTNTPPLIKPNDSVSFDFYAGQGQAISFVTMYGWSNDLFFAPANPGITLYQNDGTPIEGDVSSQIKLWDNGTRVNQLYTAANVPSMAQRPSGTAESKNVAEITGTTDAEGNTYAAASSLMKVTLKYQGNSKFTITIKNISGGSATNETGFSPGVWAISYVAANNQLNPNPLYKAGEPTANGLTDVAEKGDISALSAYIQGQTGALTPLSPILVTVYTGAENPLYKVGEKDRKKGLKELAQRGNAEILADSLEKLPNVKEVHVLKTTVKQPLPPGILLPAKLSGPNSVSVKLKVAAGDRLAIATMYGFSNDWFFASKDNGVDATKKGDISSSIGLYDNGTAVDQFPGAGIRIKEDGTPSNLAEDKTIQPVPLTKAQNGFIDLTSVQNFIKATIE